ncbi:Phosphatidate phosphatase/4-nitrophenylphosphatase [Chlorociboria aeruginascens]|nr:Phosphatidate phosphatase/4-nitrophenylphosphatase [Chlorociboria aeruginascens]
MQNFTMQNFAMQNSEEQQPFNMTQEEFDSLIAQDDNFSASAYYDLQDPYSNYQPTQNFRTGQPLDNSEWINQPLQSIPMSNEDTQGLDLNYDWSNFQASGRSYQEVLPKQRPELVALPKYKNQSSIRKAKLSPRSESSYGSVTSSPRSQRRRRLKSPEGRQRKPRESHQRRYQKPKADPTKPHVIINANTQGINRRSENIQSFNPLRYYLPLVTQPASWGVKPVTGDPLFTYTKDGELDPYIRFSKTQFCYFIFNHPLNPPPSSNASLRESGLTLWIQKTPSDCKRRYPNGKSDKCRFEDCPISHNTIHKGDFRVALDEQHKKKNKSDPFHNAGYVHLWCLEKFFDFPTLCRQVNIRADDRVLREGKNKMAVTRDFPEMLRVIDAFVEKCSPWEDGKPQGYYQHTLNYALTMEQLRLEPKNRALVRKRRGGNTIDLHLNNLEVYIANSENLRWENLHGKRRSSMSSDDDVDIVSKRPRLESRAPKASRKTPSASPKALKYPQSPRIFGLRKIDNDTKSKRLTMSGSMPGFGDGDGVVAEGRERGARRRKLAGYLKAANDIRQSYRQSYTQKWENGELQDNSLDIPGSFPDVAIASHGDEQLVLFPSYAKRHTKRPPNPDDASNQRGRDSSVDGSGDADYWAREWQKYEDDRAVVDVDVRGWVYSPHRGPMTRKNRLLIGLARQLSGIPAPKSRDPSPDSAGSLRARHREHEARREEERIAQEAEQIMQKGQGEENAAARGDYSEIPKIDSDSESLYSERGRYANLSPQQSPADSPTPGPGHLAKRASWNQPSDMTQEELLTANAHLMARLQPFLTNPLVSIPITVFFYDEKSSVSRTITTNEAGHFIMRASLDFVPTHVRVLASEQLSTIEEVKILESKGVSLISDVDDTIKHSSIGSGAREIFRNAFIRELGDLTIDGVREWYNTLYDMGVGIHYVSNSPWQLFPVLVSYFRTAGLPPGSYHLKQYSGMLQGIFEPVAERKKGTLEKIMRDFPERRFILVGDSGEADLEVYTDVVLANPGKVLAIFIRDVTTPLNQGFFDSAMGPLSGDRHRGKEQLPRLASEETRRSQAFDTADTPEQRPALPPRIVSEAQTQTSDGPTMGKLIDFDEESQKTSVHESHKDVMPRSMSNFDSLESRSGNPPSNSSFKAPPPRPNKPIALRGLTKGVSLEAPAKLPRDSPPPPPPRRILSNKVGSASHPLSQSQSISDLRKSDESYISSARRGVSAAYNALPEVRSYIPGHRGPNSDLPSSTASSEKPLPPPRRRRTSNSTGSQGSKRRSWNRSTDSSDDEAYSPTPSVPVNKKLDLWKRRWKRAKDILDSKGVPLRSWRIGEDVSLEAVQMVEKTFKKMGIEGYGTNGKGKTGEGGGEIKVKDLNR